MRMMFYHGEMGVFMDIVEHVVEIMLEPEAELDNDDDGSYNFIGELQPKERKAEDRQRVQKWI